jgi:LysM repeat protein
MKAKNKVLWTSLVLALILVSCGGADEEVTTGVPDVAPTATVTPIVIFDESPDPTPTDTPYVPPSLYLEPSVTNLTVGGSAAINIWADSVAQMNGIALEMSFNPNYVQVQDANPDVEGIQIATGAMPQPDTVNNNEVTVGEDGRIVYNVAQAPGTGANGSGIVATIVLQGVAEGGTPLRFESVSASDDTGNPIDILPLSDGMITIAAAVAEATPTTEPEQPTTQPTAAATAQPTSAAQPTAAPTAAPPPVSGHGIYYVVQPGENLYRIGLRFNVTVDTIAAASNITNPDTVQAGAMVLIPITLPQGGYGYYVQPRDTVYSIARRFGMTVDHLVALNGIGADYHIEPSQILSVRP